MADVCACATRVPKTPAAAAATDAAKLRMMDRRDAF
jgi:hypothetical protein